MDGNLRKEWGYEHEGDGVVVVCGRHFSFGVWLFLVGLGLVPVVFGWIWKMDYCFQNDKRSRSWCCDD